MTNRSSAKRGGALELPAARWNCRLRADAVRPADAAF